MADLTTQSSARPSTRRWRICIIWACPNLGAQAVDRPHHDGQAYLLAADDIFWVSGWICFALIGMVWLCRRAKSGGGPPPAAD